MDPSKSYWPLGTRNRMKVELQGAAALAGGQCGENSGERLGNGVNLA